MQKRLPSLGVSLGRKRCAKSQRIAVEGLISAMEQPVPWRDVVRRSWCAARIRTGRWTPRRAGGPSRHHHHLSADRQGERARCRSTRRAVFSPAGVSQCRRVERAAHQGVPHAHAGALFHGHNANFHGMAKRFKTESENSSSTSAPVFRRRAFQFCTPKQRFPRGAAP